MCAGAARHAEEIASGIAACREGNWREGYEILNEVAHHEDSDGPFEGYFYSYLGVAIARREGRKREGVELARYGVELDPRDPESRLNLARAYLLIRNRRGAIRQLKIGLQLSPGNRALRSLRDRIGLRRRPFIPFLSRDFFLNQWVGRYTYQMEKRRLALAEIEREEEEFERLAGE